MPLSSIETLAQREQPAWLQVSVPGEWGLCCELKSRFTISWANTKRENLNLAALSNIKGTLEDTFYTSFLQQRHLCGPALSLRLQTKYKKNRCARQ